MIINETGKTFGKWMVISPAEKPQHRKGNAAYFLCECQCANKTQRVVAGNALRRKVSTNCGCNWKHAIRTADAPFNMLLCDYQRSAAKRGKPFLLTLDDIKKLTQSECNYCGSPPRTPLKPMAKHQFFYNGIDRVDNSIGYTTTNCVTCCKTCNTAKMAMTISEFKEWVRNVYTRICE